MLTWTTKTWVITRCPRKHIKGEKKCNWAPLRFRFQGCGSQGWGHVLRHDGVKKRMTEDPRTKKSSHFLMTRQYHGLKIKNKQGWTRLNHCLVKVEGNHKPFQKTCHPESTTPQAISTFVLPSRWQWLAMIQWSHMFIVWYDVSISYLSSPFQPWLIPSHKLDWSLKVSIWWSYDDVSLVYIVAGIQMIKPPHLQSGSVYVHFIILYVLYGWVCINITSPAILR